MTAHSASAPAPASAAAPPPPRRGALGQLLANPAAVAGALLLFLILLAALAAPWLFPHDPLDMVGPPILWPGQDPGFWLGTDTMGRDVAAGLAHGARVSLTVGVAAAMLSLLIGIAVGAAAGYFGGWVDVALMRVTELLQTIPAFLLVVVIVAIARPSVTVIALSIGVASWPVVARLVRAEFRTLRESEFVQAARTLGYGHARIALLEILPNALPPVIVTTSVLVANAILMESALSFMNMGDPNAVSWGSMIGDAREMLRTAWYLAALPGVSIILTVLSLNLLGDALNDAFNPRLSR
ncbi:ABC transporter permease [Achromobacter xylosoxidans]|jgi:peptide/nickel transport system permease protein|uniref:ABC transporter permease n=1 Tax=Alcaligenes xylosoxydans xylosoxydans TaxID=85698 RepID=A0A9W5A889_ALCXX|nr:ABC transporter permease [Achromobacter xylosoxidans]MCH4572883.1 ABC transporter permease [Achromobacter xylosoxidans]MCZ8401905.1 ABC transporter permease [Achromobacter xylosoxidans]MDD7991460.1 ABC transporter permease [Achromobacter xylosoxidans]NEV06261.1 ABC transporter permease subunit [Achromobacter xylosoxidans]OFO65388.1 ABC transporter permease [Achromobacter xylosoxidans]